MNTHFRNCKSITPINKGAHKIYKDNTLITAYNNTIYYVDTTTGKIENSITYNKEVTYFTEFKDDLIVGLEDGTLLYGDLSYKLHKTVISCISIIDDFIVTTSYDKTMKMQNNLFETLSTVYCRNMPLKIVNCKDHIATYDVESNIYLYEKNSGKRYRFRVLDDKIVNVLFDSNILYVFYSDSICRVYFSKEINKLQAKLYLDNKNSEINAGSLDYDTNNHEYNITDSIITNNSIYAVGDCPDIITFSLSCQMISVNNVKISGNRTKGIEYKRIEYNNNFVLTSTEDEIIYLDNNFEIDYVIIGNNDEITDFCVYHDTLFIATNSGRLRYMEYRDDEGQYACKGHILEAHEEAIMCIKFCDNYFATASRDKKLKLWKISENDESVKKVKYSNNLKIEMLHEIETHLESVNSCDIAPGLLVSVGKDNSLQIFKYDENIEQIFNKVVHNKEINYVKICQERRLIVTASQDKSIKAFDFAGTELGTMNGHRKGVWGLDVGKDILVSCSSDETVRVWSLNDFSCIKILEGFNCTILKVKLYKEDTKVIAAGVNGLVKIWDIKKNRIIGTYNIHTDKVWALLYHENNIVTGSADGAICMLNDETEEKTLEMKKFENVEKEMKFEIIKSIQNKDFLNALKISYNFTDIDEIYRLVVECVNSKVSIESIFETFENDHSKIMKAISKYIKYFRFAAVNHLLIKECLKRKLFEKKDDALMKVIQKNYNALNDLYIDLVGYEIIFRDFLEEAK